MLGEQGPRLYLGTRPLNRLISLSLSTNAARCKPSFRRSSRYRRLISFFKRSNWQHSRAANHVVRVKGEGRGRGGKAWF
jgi:hypothetical protein